MYKYEIEIIGMMCSMCEAHVNDVIRKNLNVKKIKSNYKKKLTTFISEELVEEAQIKKLISSTGYEVRNIKYEKK